MLVADSTIAISIFFSLIFTTFYSMSDSHKEFLRKLDFSFQLVMAAGILIVLFAAELEPYPIKFGGQTLLLWLTVITVFITGICIVILLGFESNSGAAFMMGGYIAVMSLLDLIFLTTHVNKFWVPSFITVCVLSVFWILHFFDVP